MTAASPLRQPSTPPTLSFRSGAVTHPTVGPRAAASPAVNLWQAVQADTAGEVRDRLHLDGLTPDPPTEYEAVVLYKMSRCAMRLGCADDRLRIVRLATRPGEKERVMVDVPMYRVLNIETPEEGEQRRRLHVMRDGTTGMSMRASWRPLSDHESPLAKTCTGESAASSPCTPSGARTAVTASGRFAHRAGMSTCPLGVVVPPPFALAAFMAPDTYLLHYCDTDAVCGGPSSVHTLKLRVPSEPQAATRVWELVKAVLRRIYRSGPQTLLTFISPKSGTGQGERIYRTQVGPLLQYTRHVPHVLVTTRAHDAEDYVAHTDHYMDDGCVLVAMGGDGMVHEVVNGLHRRRETLAAVIRAECRRRTVACVASPAPVFHETELCGAPAPVVPPRSGGEGDSEGNAYVSVDAAGRACELRQTPLAMRGGLIVDAEAGSEMAAIAPTIASAAVNVEGVGAREGKGAAAALLYEPIAGIDEAPPQTAHVHRDGSDKVSQDLRPLPGSPPLRAHVTGPQGLLATDAAYAAHVTDLFLARGWAGLLPRVATVPTGSACGLAKSLDVLSPTRAALALVHGAWVPQDLVHMHFTPNADLIAFHRERWGPKKLRRAEERFETYLKRTRIEREQRAVASGSGAVSVHPLRDPPQGQQEPREREEEWSPSCALLTSRAGGDGDGYGSTGRATDGGSGSSVAASARVHGLSGASPFLRDGTGVYADPVSMTLGAPEVPNRICFMSLSFGVPNDIDHGSEHLRWMGNARFAVYGVYTLLRGLSAYRTTIRYLPWEDRRGFKLEKLHRSDKIPHPSQLPRCTMRADCPHCLAHAAPLPLVEASRAAELRRRGGAAAPTPSEREAIRAESMVERAEDLRCSTRVYDTPRDLRLDPAVVADAPDADLLGVDDVDFADESLPWVTIRGEAYNLLICNLRDVAQDMMMAPLSHMSDGAMDIIFSRVDPERPHGGRYGFLQFFSRLETGDHVNLPFANYVKARAVEVKVDGGIAMSDGEMMPLSSVRLTKIRSGCRFVRLDG